jgi:predicted O-methyltransferase YrrM
VGASWIVTGLRPGASFVTVELDPGRAGAVRQRFKRFSQVQVIEGDWRATLAHGPFALLFADAAPAKVEAETLLEALRPGGLLLLDDLTPFDRLSLEQRAVADPLREFWLGDTRVAGAEVQVRPTESVLLATRR